MTIQEICFKVIDVEIRVSQTIRASHGLERNGHLRGSQSELSASDPAFEICRAQERLASIMVKTQAAAQGQVSLGEARIFKNPRHVERGNNAFVAALQTRVGQPGKSGASGEA